MAFNLPSAQYLMDLSGAQNRGSYDAAMAIANNGLKVAGGLPLSGAQATEITNNSGSRGIYFGLSSQTSALEFDASANTKVLLTSVQFNAPNRIQVDTLLNRGVTARLISGGDTSNFKEFLIGGNDTPFADSQAGAVTICLDLSSLSEDSSGGSYNPSQASGWGFGTTKFNMSGGSSSLAFFQRFFVFDTGKGQPNLPYFEGNSDFSEALASVKGTNYTNKTGSWITKSGSSFFIPIPFSFGNGTASVNFNDNGVSIESPSDNATGQENFRLSNDSMRVYYNPSSVPLDNNCVLSGSYSYGTAAKWDFNVDAPHTLSGNFTGMGDITSGSGGLLSGNFNLASGSFVICNGANINNINVEGDVKIQGNTVTDFIGLTINGALDFDTAGTYNVSGSNINEVTNSSGGVVVINSTNSTININTDPNIIINSSTAFALTGLQISSEVRIYEAGTTTELAGVENSGASFITTLSVSFVDVSILSLGFQNLRLKNIDTTVDVALPVQQVFDRQYENN